MKSDSIKIIVDGIEIGEIELSYEMVVPCSSCGKLHGKTEACEKQNESLR